MSYNGSGTFVVNSTGQPVVTGTVISSTAFNALTADLATGLSTAITKDGQTTTTARVPFAQGINSTLTTDATSATTGSIITAGGISCQKAAVVGTLLGVGMAPVNVLDITQNQNNLSTVSILNNDAGTTAQARFQATNGTSVGLFGTTGQNFTPAAIFSGGDTYVIAQGNNLDLVAAAAIKFAVNNTSAEIARFDTSSNLLMGTTGVTGGLNGKVINLFGSSTVRNIVQTTGQYAAVNVGSGGTSATPTTSAFLYTDGTNNAAHVGTTTSTPLLFDINGTEVARFDTSGNLLVGTTTNLGQSEFRKSGGDYVLRLTNTNASPYALRLGYSAADPNNATNTFIFADGTGGARFIVYSNGGIANYSANNVNLSDVGVKPFIENIADSADLSAALWEAHKNIDWNRHKYEDQTHDDWNYGYTAQGVRKAFAKVAPELVDFWEEGKSDKLAVYHHDVTNITGAVVTMLQSENEALKASIAELTTRLAALENK